MAAASSIGIGHEAASSTMPQQQHGRSNYYGHLYVSATAVVEENNKEKQNGRRALLSGGVLIGIKNYPEEFGWTTCSSKIFFHDNNDNIYVRR
jgi:hypothetical protein